MKVKLYQHPIATLSGIQKLSFFDAVNICKDSSRIIFMTVPSSDVEFCQYLAVILQTTYTNRAAQVIIINNGVGLLVSKNSFNGNTK